MWGAEMKDNGESRGWQWTPLSSDFSSSPFATLRQKLEMEMKNGSRHITLQNLSNIGTGANP